MSYFSEETPPAGHHPYGELSRVWERGVFAGLYVTLPLVSISLAQTASDGSMPSRAGAVAWLAYALVQIASKTPVSFTYPLRGWRAAVDLGAFTVLAFATIAFAVGGDTGLVPAAFWYGGLALVALSWVVYASTPAKVDPGAKPIHLGRQVFAGLVSFSVSLPMIYALWRVARLAS